MNEALGSPAHQALIEHVVAHYAGDDRIRAVAVFGSVGAGRLSVADLVEAGLAAAGPAGDASLGPRRRALLDQA